MRCQKCYHNFHILSYIIYSLLYLSAFLETWILTSPSSPAPRGHEMQIHHHRQRPQGDELGKSWDSLTYCWWVDGSELLQLRLVVYSHYLQGFFICFIHPRWLLGISSINSIKCPLKQKSVTISRPVEVHRSFSLGPWITWATCFGVEGTNVGSCSSVSEWITWYHMSCRVQATSYSHTSNDVLQDATGIQTSDPNTCHCPIQNRYSETRGNNSSTASVASSSAKVVKRLVVAFAGLRDVPHVMPLHNISSKTCPNRTSKNRCFVVSCHHNICSRPDSCSFEQCFLLYPAYILSICVCIARILPPPPRRVHTTCLHSSNSAYASPHNLIHIPNAYASGWKTYFLCVLTL